MAGSARVQVECPACAADIVMDDVSNGGNTGGCVLKCQNCGHIFHFRLDQDVSNVKGKRPANPANSAYRLIFAREIVSPLTGKLRGTYVDDDGAFGSGATAALDCCGETADR